MNIISRQQAAGSQIKLQSNRKMHIPEEDPRSFKATDPSESFSKLLFSMVEQTNQSQLNADQLELQMVIEPEKVNIHEVVIAAEEARLSLSFMKSITEKAVKAYNDILSIR